MEAPPIPKDDLARVGSLRRLGLLDTEPDDRFDRITRITRRLLDVNTAQVNLVDIDRQWTKSRSGLDRPWPTAASDRRTGKANRDTAATVARTSADLPREYSLCAHAIVGRELLEVADTAADNRFRDNPWVSGQAPVRFYAGCPIASPDGSVIGTLCVLDEHPRTLDYNERAAFRDLAAVVEREIATSRLAVDDDLTGLVNRRGFTLVGSQALAFCERQEVDALVVVATVDGLELADQRGGPSAGEQLLRMAATAVADLFRASDVVGRISRDQFAALLTGYKGSEAQIADRLRSAVAAGNLEFERTTFGLSMTVGFAWFDHRDPELLEALLHRADVRRGDLRLDRTSARAEGA